MNSMKTLCTQLHLFDQEDVSAEKSVLLATLLTAFTMVIEVVGGWLLNSMALLADGWHMGSHTLALGLSAAAYYVARRLAHDARFTFGTWKIKVLGGYTSAILLVGVAGLMVYQSVKALVTPFPIRYDEALAIAVLGLVVNFICAWLLKEKHHHHHHHDHHGEILSDHHTAHDHASHHDLNLRAAYLHVLADAATSILAILALLGGKFWGAAWLDPVMGILGASLVVVWAYGLLQETGFALLDAEIDLSVVTKIKNTIANHAVHSDIADLHVWRVGKDQYACILSLVVDDCIVLEDIKKQLYLHRELVHITIEISSCKNKI